MPGSKSIYYFSRGLSPRLKANVVVDLERRWTVKIPDGVIYLAKPIFGKRVLRGKVTVMTTWLDYFFPETLTPAELGLPDEQLSYKQVRVLIPLDNVLAVVAEREAVTPDELLLTTNTGPA